MSAEFKWNKDYLAKFAGYRHSLRQVGVNILQMFLESMNRVLLLYLVTKFHICMTYTAWLSIVSQIYLKIGSPLYIKSPLASINKHYVTYFLDHVEDPYALFLLSLASYLAYVTGSLVTLTQADVIWKWILNKVT